MLGYPDGTKGYMLWCFDLGEKRCIIIRDVVFNEQHIPLIEKNWVNSGPVQRVEPNTEIKVEFDQGQEDMIGSFDEEEDHNSELQENDVNDYKVVRDRQRRTIRPFDRFGYADVIAYALSVTQEANFMEPATY